MKKYEAFLLFAFILFTQGISAQIIPIEWQKNYGGSYDDSGAAIDKTSDGGYILLGTTRSTDRDVTGLHGNLYDVWAIKTNSSGNIEWKKCLGGTGTDVAKLVRATSDGGYIIVADTNSNNGDLTGHFGNLNVKDAWIVKLDSIGNIQWQHHFGGTSEDSVSSVVETSQGFLMVGYSYSSNENIPANKGGTDAFAAFYDKQGNLQWVKNYGGSRYDYASSVVADDDGFVIAGRSASVDGDLLNANYHLNGSGVFYTDYWVFKIDFSGNMIWSKYYGGPAEDRATSIAKTSDGGYIVLGDVQAYGGDITQNGDDDFWVVKLNANGNMQWQKTYGGPGFDTPEEIRPTQDGGYILTGITTGNGRDVTGYHSGIPGDMWVLKINTSGGVEWQRALGGSKIDRGMGVVEANDGGFVAVGTTASPGGDGDVVGNPHAVADLWLVKLNSGILDTSEAYITEKELINIYPNPATELFFIDSKSSVIQVSIYNAAGKLISEYFSTNQPIDIKNFITGVYFVHVKTKKETIVRKLIKK